jgi:hypothetical protein
VAIGAGTECDIHYAQSMFQELPKFLEMQNEYISTKEKLQACEQGKSSVNQSSRKTQKETGEKKQDGAYSQGNLGGKSY